MKDVLGFLRTFIRRSNYFSSFPRRIAFILIRESNGTHRDAQREMRKERMHKERESSDNIKAGTDSPVLSEGAEPFCSLAVISVSVASKEESRSRENIRVKELAWHTTDTHSIPDSTRSLEHKGSSTF